MKASVIVVLGLVVIGLALAHYIVGFCLVGAIVHQAGRWRREARQRSTDAVALDALRSIAAEPSVRYTGVLNPASSAWFDRAGR